MTYTLTVVGSEGDGGTDGVEAQARDVASRLPGVSHATLQTGDGGYVDLLAPAETDAPAADASAGEGMGSGV